MAKVAAKAKDRPVKKKQTVGMKILTILFSIVSVFYVAPVFIVLMNSFKSNAAISRAIFEFPNANSFQGFQSYMTGMFHGNYPFWKSIVWSLLHYNRRCCAYSFLHINVCVVLAAFKFSYMQNHLLFLHFLNGYSFPDGNVYSGKDSRYPETEQSVQYLHYLPGIWSRAGCVYVYRLCKRNSAGN